MPAVPPTHASRELTGIRPEQCFDALAPRGADLVWLDDSPHGRHLIGLGAQRTVVPAEHPDPLGVVEAALEQDAGPWVGWFAYEAGVRALGLQPHHSRTAAASWLRLDRWVEWTGGATIAVAPRGSLDEWVTTVTSFGRADVVCDRAATPPSAPVTPGDEAWSADRAEYLAQIERCKGHIADGDSYLMCLTMHLDVQQSIDTAATYRALRASSPVHHGGFVRIAGVTLLSASPETFLARAGARVETHPIKGTRPRRTGPDDAREASALRTSVKERAENVMIVDLMRNDLQRVCEPGSVHVPSLLRIESYAHVHQLVSTVAGTLRDGVSTIDLLRAAFPAGSMTGAPKRRTVELLGEIEGAPRGVYSGCFGIVDGDDAQFAMVIRSIVVDATGASIGVGGGITALSVATDEYDEVRLKARALVAALRSEGDISRRGAI